MTAQDKIVEKLVTARIALLLKQPFFGNLATRLKIVNADEWCPTAATDGRRFYYNSEFIDSLTPRETEFLFGHEVLHCVFDHFLSRAGSRDAKLWNIAADYAVNQILNDYRIGDMPKGEDGKDKGFFDPKYKDWPAEKIYDDILDNAEEYGESFLDKLGELLDEHIDWEKGENSSDKDGKGGKAPTLSKDEIKQIKDEMKEAMISAAQSTGAGNLPGSIQKMVKDLTEPKMNWKEILQQQIVSTIKSDYSFMRPSRRGWHSNAILPGMLNEDTIKLCVALDASGSISDQQTKECLSEIKGIMDQYKDFEILLFSFDTQVFNPATFTPDNASELTEYTIGAGGGTEFGCIWNYLKDEDIVPAKLVVFTDGYPWGTWGDENYCDTIFLINNSYDKGIEAPFGTTIYYEN